MRIRLLIVVAGLTLLPAVAGAQERGRVGVTMGYPAGVGFIWHVTETVAVRPEVSLSHSSSEVRSTTLATSSSDSWTVNGGVSAIWYVGRHDNVRTYVSPRLTFGHGSADSSSLADPISSNTVGGSVSFGAQYFPARKFSVFGEVGYGFSRLTTELTTPIGTAKTTGWGSSLRSGVGVALYLGRS